VAGGRVANIDPAPTLCDALLTPTPGEITFAINRRLLAGGVAVADAEVRAAVRLAFQHLKLVIEPGGAVALAAALHRRLPLQGTVGIVVSGGNVDPDLYAGILAGA
jgi:threonine dehydratase